MRARFEQHMHSNRTQLENWRAEITAMRAQSWPYAKIAQWLLEEQDFKIGQEAIRRFCKSRNIRKRRFVQRNPTPVEQDFFYDEDRPTPIRHDP